MKQTAAARVGCYVREDLHGSVASTQRAEMATTLPDDTYIYLRRYIYVSQSAEEYSDYGILPDDSIGSRARCLCDKQHYTLLLPFGCLLPPGRQPSGCCFATTPLLPRL